MDGPVDWDALRLSVDRMYVGAVMLDASLRVHAVDDRLLDCIGMTLDEYLALDPIDLVHPDERSQAIAGLAESMAVGGARLPTRYRCWVKGGTWEPFEIRATAMGPQHDHAILLQFFEVTEEFQAYAFATEVVELMQVLVSPGHLDDNLIRVVNFAQRYVPDMTMAVTTCDGHGRPTTVSLAEVPSTGDVDRRCHDLQTLPGHVQQALANHRRSDHDLYRPGVFDDEMKGRLTIAAAADDGPLLGYIEAFRTTDEPPSDAEWLVYSSAQRLVTTALARRQLDEQLQHAADRDPLTGLFNRRRLLAEMTEGRAATNSAVMLVDIDRFSWINNTFGHRAGDLALTAVADAIVAALPDFGVAARWGGDEFVVVIPDIDSTDDVSRLADEIRTGIQVPVGLGDPHSTIRCSVGTTILVPGEAPEDAINRADLNMYSEKRSSARPLSAGKTQ